MGWRLGQHRVRKFMGFLAVLRSRVDGIHDVRCENTKCLHGKSVVRQGSSHHGTSLALSPQIRRLRAGPPCTVRPGLAPMPVLAYLSV